ncbi:hypothetical protein LMG28614_03127 [Paraburkholderia ultramafica]|uniref:Fido domain-containing protein n=2 Tax=Paraburkholderia ultramafica TaxID=1544867 RepID=A0A6S7B9M1_9BURK|nr:hypothetical protein LMG28614_03127 [Paraburkholderia ultramafica]
MYAEAIARGHAFSDANKRTALVSALTYLLMEGYLVERTAALEDIMIDVAQGALNHLDVANIFSGLVFPRTLCGELGVQLHPRMTFPVSLDQGRLESADTSMNTVFALHTANHALPNLHRGPKEPVNIPRRTKQFRKKKRVLNRLYLANLRPDASPTEDFLVRSQHAPAERT